MGSKAREGAKAVSLAFVLLDFQHAGVRRRAYCTRRSIDIVLIYIIALFSALGQTHCTLVACDSK